MKLMLEVIFTLIISVFSVTSFAQSCIQYFNDPKLDNSAFLQEALQREVRRTGTAHKQPYLVFNSQARLRYYDPTPSRVYPTMNTKPQLKFEELDDFGFRTAQEVEILKNTIGEESIEAFYFPKIGMYQVFRWGAILDVTIDAKTRVIDANDDSGKFLLRQLVEGATQTLDSKDTKKTSMTYGLLFVDLNNLKLLNSTRRAHMAGDEYLSRALEIVKSKLRLGEDRADHDVGFKVGGDEFVFILADVDATKIRVIADRITKAVQEDAQLLELFYEPQVEFHNLLKKIDSLQSFAQLSKHKAILEFLRQTELWSTLSLAALDRIRKSEQHFRSFI